jgi:hypothetical protein
VVVYGPTQDEYKENFLAELVNMYNHENLRLVMGGDYNILRHPTEKIMITIKLNALSCLMSLLMV